MQFELIFEGTIDDSQETLRSIKRVLLANFDFSVDEVRCVVDEAPCVLKKASSQKALIPLYNLLEEAGSIVTISSGREESQMEWEEDDDEELWDDDDEFEIEIEGEQESHEPRNNSRTPGRVYTLDPEGNDETIEEKRPEEDFTDKIDELVKALEVTTQVSKADHPSLEEIVRPKIPKGSPSALLDDTIHKKSSPSQDKTPVKNRPVTSPQEDIKIQHPRNNKDAKQKKAAQKTAQVGKPLRKKKPKDSSRSKKRNKEKPSPFRNTIAAIVIILCILLAGSTFFFEILSDTQHTSDGLVTDQDNIIFKAADQNSERTIKASFNIRNKLLQSLLITIELPAPTDKDMRTDKNRPFRLEKIMIQEIEIRKTEDHGFLAVGLAKLFANYGISKKEFSADTVVTGELNQEQKSLQVQILVNKGFTDLPRDTQFKLIKHKDHTFKLFLSAKIEAKVL